MRAIVQGLPYLLSFAIGLGGAIAAAGYAFFMIVWMHAPPDKVLLVAAVAAGLFALLAWGLFVVVRIALRRAIPIKGP